MIKDLIKDKGLTFVVFTFFVGIVGAMGSMAYNSYQKINTNKTLFFASYDSADYKMKQLDCLTKNIYYEAATEPFEGKVAVAQVTLNRVGDSRFPKSVCEVVYQKNVIYEKVICQFSWYCNSPSSLKVINKKLYKESERVAKLVLFEDFRLSSVENSIYYHADYVNPGWKKVKVAKIGRHIFYE